MSKIVSWDKPKCHISFDIDGVEDIDQLPRLLKILDKHDIKCSFAVVGHLIEKYPDIHKELVNRGHELINHTYSHPDTGFVNLSSEQIEAEIIRCEQAMPEYEFQGFRIPHFGNQYTDKIYPVLKKLGYRYSSSTIAYQTPLAGFPYIVADCSGIWEFPLTCCPKHARCIFDSSHAFRSKFARHTSKDFVWTFKRLVDKAIKNNMFLNIYLDPRDIVRFDFDWLLCYIKPKDNLDIVSLGGMVRWIKK